MTKKHFQAIALALHDSKPTETRKLFNEHTGEETLVEDWKLVHQWEKDMYAMIQVCKAANPKFDSEIFKRWCKEGKPSIK